MRALVAGTQLRGVTIVPMFRFATQGFVQIVLEATCGVTLLAVAGPLINLAPSAQRAWECVLMVGATPLARCVPISVVPKLDADAVS